jgi:hypothetical protein
MDGAGFPATFIPPVSYQVQVMGSANLSKFDVSFSYDDDLGHLGNRVLDFAPPMGTSGTIQLSGPSGFQLPALPPGDHITQSGSFVMMETGNGGTAAAIKVFGVAPFPITPEPSSLLLAVVGFVAAAWAMRRSRIRRGACKTPPGLVGQRANVARRSGSGSDSWLNGLRLLPEPVSRAVVHLQSRQARSVAEPLRHQDAGRNPFDFGRRYSHGVEVLDSYRQSRP